jgi:hydroxyethylthiazole kinase-like sugar kinase family protein
VTDGRRVLRCRGGTPTLKLITATGCSVTALIAAFLAATPEDPVFAAAAALSVFGCAHNACTLKVVLCAQRNNMHGHSTVQLPGTRRLAATRGVSADADSRGPGSLRVALLDGLHSLSTSKWSAKELDTIYVTEDGCQSGS